MSLKRKLSFRSTLLFTCTMLFITIGTYWLSLYFTDRAYKRELVRIARLSAMFYLEKDELNARLHKGIEEEFMKISEISVQLYHTGDKIYWGDSSQHPQSSQVIEQTIRDGQTYFKYGKRSTLTYYYQDNQGDFIIVVSGEDESGREQVRLLGEMLLLFGLLGSGVHLFFSILLARKTFEPFQRLINEVRSIRGNDWHSRLTVPQSDNDEIKQLINEFNHLLGRIEDRVLIQRNFLRNTSHEIKTPLAIIIGDVEVALNNERSSKEYAEILGSLKKNALHLRSIIESLTALSDIEVAGTELITQFRIDEVIWEVVAKKKIEYPLRQVNVYFHDGSDSNDSILVVHANRALTLIAISNIVDNALKYSEENVEIIIHASKLPLSIEIIDAGIGIDAEELDKIFHIFYRSPVTRHIQGHGIGLYLAHQILVLNGANVKASSKKLHGTTFTITFSKPVFTTPGADFRDGTWRTSRA